MPKKNRGPWSKKFENRWAKLYAESVVGENRSIIWCDTRKAQ